MQHNSRGKIGRGWHYLIRSYSNTVRYLLCPGKAAVSLTSYPCFTTDCTIIGCRPTKLLPLKGLGQIIISTERKLLEHLVGLGPYLYTSVACRKACMYRVDFGAAWCSCCSTGQWHYVRTKAEGWLQIVCSGLLPRWTNSPAIGWLQIIALVTVTGG